VSPLQTSCRACRVPHRITPSSPECPCIVVYDLYQGTLSSLDAKSNAVMVVSYSHAAIKNVCHKILCKNKLRKGLEHGATLDFGV
jgi:hypothetical protein